MASKFQFAEQSLSIQQSEVQEIVVQNDRSETCGLRFKRIK